MVCLKDLFTKKVNSNNYQISLDVSKTKLKELNIDIDDILKIKLNKNKIWQQQ
jgi:hypothetical protein